MNYVKPFRPAKYWFGEDRSGYAVVPIALCRDSTVLDKSNFFAMWKMLSGEEYSSAKNFDTDGTEDVAIFRDSHFAGGWVEHIYIKTHATELIEKADGLVASIIEKYPVLDDDMYEKMMDEAALEYWSCLSDDEKISIGAEFGLSEEDALVDALPSDGVYYYIRELAEQ